MRIITLPAYLALKEIWRNRGRFLLFSLVIALITLLVLFIAGLGEGLATSNREYLSKLDANLLLYQEKSDLIIAASRIALSKVEEVRNVPGVADAGPIATSLVAIVLSNGKELKVSLLGVDPGHPGEPEVKDGQQLNPSGLDEVILDQNVVSRSNLKLGDTITIRSAQGTAYKNFILKVVGITSGQSYTFAPSIFVPISTWDRIRPKSEAEMNHSSCDRQCDPGQTEPTPAKLEEVRNAIRAQVNKVLRPPPSARPSSHVPGIPPSRAPSTPRAASPCSSACW